MDDSKPDSCSCGQDHCQCGKHAAASQETASVYDPVESGENLDELIRLAESGNPEAMYKIGVFQYYGLGGLEKDPAAAVQWLFKSAQLANSDAQFALGWAYRNGEGVPQLDEPARKWFEVAAQHGHALAQNQLALCYATGRGVEKDAALALYWWKQAAEGGCEDARYNLELCYSLWWPKSADDTDCVKRS